MYLCISITLDETEVTPPAYAASGLIGPEGKQSNGLGSEYLTIETVFYADFLALIGTVCLWAFPTSGVAVNISITARRSRYPTMRPLMKRFRQWWYFLRLKTTALLVLIWWPIPVRGAFII